MMKRDTKAFIDANILIYAGSFQKDDVFEWISLVYREIYIHVEVFNELRVSSIKSKVEKYLASGKWILFDPFDEKFLPDEDMYDLYSVYVDEMREAFYQLDVKKGIEGRRIKNTNDLGEIHSLAAAMLLGAHIICSNDFDIAEVIKDEGVYIDSEEESELLKQDTLVDVCALIIANEIAERGVVRKFLKAVYPDGVKTLEELIK